ncbi:hydroxymethylglutaryl-CoA synthase [Nicoliella spurrieriana]|uniref:Hydroxymethylglutaryl-CoA synthase n=1 Tax=Nicoliella spurrieriana TaxID=2925830 RepID=A0A976RRD5_9LACO|nr:hydroxymethylglutaryl-CoA synthase [Nicoliella spurrieriana]UQS86487.1 hydroxymethylglutaryl-CoA synthase [Nicoliella spurrieriana]
MNVGIDAISFYTPEMYLSMEELALARDEDPNKYLIGIGQQQQSVIPNTQDVVTMAANAADGIINDDNREHIDLVIFGTETGVDNSKSAAIYLQNLLGLNPNTRAFETKQACYGATAGLQMARDYVQLHPDKQALVIGADVARYGINTPGEVTQGGGAVAMLVTSNPRIISFDGVSSFYSKDIMDFWRPLYTTEAIVDGHYSNDVYVNFFNETWQQYKKQTGLSISDLKAMIFHLPYPKMGIKGLRSVLPEASSEQSTTLKTAFNFGSMYNKRVGNLYSGSLYLSLLSLIDNDDELVPGDLVGLFSYGSGAQGEFFTGKLEAGFFNAKRRDHIIAMLDQRKQVSVSKYETIFSSWPRLKPGDLSLPIDADNAKYVFAGVKNNQRQYLIRK